MNKEKVLFIISSLGTGGAEKVCVILLNQLCNSYQCDLLVVSGKKAAYEIDKRVNVIFLDKWKGKTNLIKKIVTIVWNIRKVNNYIKKQEKATGKYQMITAHLNMGYVLSFFLKIRKDVMYVFHNPQSHNKISRFRIYKFFFSYLFKNKKIGAVSEGIRKELIYKYGIKKENIQVVWNPIDISHIRKASLQSFQKRRDYIVGVGRLSQEKRFDRMIDIFYQGEFYKKYDLVICGEGELRKELEYKIVSLEMEHYIHMIGFQDNPYMWMKNAKLMLLTSDYEALPMCIMEALAVGVKIVAADCNYGPRELLIGEFNKYLVRPIDDISKYIVCIKEALHKYPSIESLDVERFSTEKICEKYFEVYKELG